MAMISRRQRARVIPRVLLWGALSTVAAAGQNGNFTLQVDVPVVSLDVSVTDPAGRPVDGLGPDDFEVFENGIPQTVRYFGPSTAPYHAYLLVDVSGSTENKRNFMQEAIRGFVGSLAPADLVSVGVFGHALVRIRDWAPPGRSAVEALDPIIDQEPMAGTTEFYKSLDEVMKGAFEDIPERKAVIVLTDGRDTSLYTELARRSRLLDIEDDQMFQSVYRRAASSGVALYFVAVNTDQNLEPNNEGADEYRNLGVIFGDSALPELYLEQVRLRMERLAAVSGGKVFFPQSIADVREPFEEIARSLSGAYSLGYAPEDGAGDESRRITVRLRSLPYAVRQSRTEYRFVP